MGCYGCTGYRTKECNYFFGNMFCGKKLTDKQIDAILTGGHTEVIKGFKKKDGGTFDAALMLDKSTGNLAFYNENNKNNEKWERMNG